MTIIEKLNEFAKEQRELIKQSKKKHKYNLMKVKIYDLYGSSRHCIHEIRKDMSHDTSSTSFFDFNHEEYRVVSFEKDTHYDEEIYKMVVKRNMLDRNSYIKERKDLQQVMDIINRDLKLGD